VKQVGKEGGGVWHSAQQHEKKGKGTLEPICRARFKKGGEGKRTCQARMSRGEEGSAHVGEQDAIRGRKRKKGRRKKDCLIDHDQTRGEKKKRWMKSMFTRRNGGKKGKKGGRSPFCEVVEKKKKKEPHPVRIPNGLRRGGGKERISPFPRS